MGHDITAIAHGAIKPPYIRRSAFDPLNQVIYLALGVADEAYGGCSGIGCTISFKSAQLELGLALLDTKSYDSMQRPDNIADDFLRVMGGDPEAVTALNADMRPDVEQERAFLVDSIRYLRRTGSPTLDIHFG